MSTGTLSSRIAGGAAWMIGLRLGVRGLGFVSTIVLARLLVPADFGLVAMAMTVSSVLDTVLELNFSIALITERRDDRAFYDAAWTWSILKGILVAAALAVTAPLIARYFDDARIVPIVYVLAVSSLIAGFQNPAVVNFIRDLEMHRTFTIGLGAKILSFAVTLAAAIIFRNYWALVLGSLTGSAATVLLSFIMCDFRPRFGFARSRELLGFSSWLMLTNIIGAVRGQIDPIVIGRIISARALGIYRIAWEISSLAATEIMMPVRQALFPGFVKWADDRDKLAQNYMESQAIMFSIALPIAVGIGLVADPLVRVLLGSQWLDAVPVMRILLVGAIVQTICDNGWTVLNALRKPHINTVIGAVTTVFYAVAVLYGVKAGGLVGAAIGHALASVLYLVCNSLALRRFMRISVLSLLRLAWRTIVATALMAAAVILFQGAYLDGSGLNPFAALPLTALVGVAAFAVVHIALWGIFGRGNGVEARILEIGHSLLARRRISPGGTAKSLDALR
jgi:O-antigen/teichoic acid export membrane protein